MYGETEHPGRFDESVTWRINLFSISALPERQVVDKHQSVPETKHGRIPHINHKMPKNTNINVKHIFSSMSPK